MSPNPLNNIFKPALLATMLAATQVFSAPPETKVQTFPLGDVHLLPGMFKDAEAIDLKYILSLDADRLLAPYLREAGLPPKAQSYTNWENTGLDGHVGGHYISALAMMYAETGDKAIKTKLDYVVAELKKCQDANGNGYVGGVPGSKDLWDAIFKGNIQAQNQKWVPLYNIHKAYAGLRDAYLIGGNAQAKEMFLAFSDWFVKLSEALSDAQMEEMLRTEHGGINEELADAYQLTGQKKYLTAAYKFSHKAILEPLQKGEDKLNNLHANTQIPKVIGFERIATVAHDESYEKAARFFWETVTQNRSVAIGGNSVREHFHPSNNFTPMVTSEEGPETCNSYNMLKLTHMLYETNPGARYMDFYERALFNHILSSQHPEKGGFVYFTPMRPGHYRVYSQPQQGMWCCVGSGMENHAKYNEMIYAHDNENLYVNLFISSTLRSKEKGWSLTQQTTFPEEDKTQITINEPGKDLKSVVVRYPSWVGKGKLKVWVNKQPFTVKATPGNWVQISRKWKKGDIVEVQFPMQLHTEQLPDGLNYVAVIYGPIVLAAKTDTANMTGLFADDSRMGHIAYGKKYPLQDMPVFLTTDTVSDLSKYIVPVKDKPLTFSAAGLIYPANYKNLELVPFYKVHSSRYVVYWQKQTPATLKAMQEKLAVEESARAALEAKTVDKVQPGEQQPESDHFMAYEKSNAGVHKDVHWRDASGWFSYRLNDKEKKASLLQITYYGLDNGRRFSIWVNGEKLADVALDGSHGDDFFTVDYTLPAAVTAKANGQYTIKFVAAENSVAGGIYGVRLLKQ